MKRVLVTMLAALLLAAPAVVSSDANAAAVTLQAKKKTLTVTFKVSMHCRKCVDKLTDNLSFLRGVKDLKISLENKTVTITYDPSRTSEAALQQAIEKCGYTAEKLG